MTGTTRVRTRRCGDRAQANLPVVAVALIVLTVVTMTTIALAEAALSSADRDGVERSAAAATADRFVAADADVTRRANVLDRSAAMAVTPSDLDGLAPPVAGRDVRLRIGDRTVLERGTPAGGTTVQRIALLAQTDAWTGRVGANGNESLSVPYRTDALTLRVLGGTVETVRVDGRIAAHDPDGIDGETDVDVSRRGRHAVTAEGTGVVEVVVARERRERVTVEVTVGDGGDRR